MSQPLPTVNVIAQQIDHALLTPDLTLTALRDGLLLAHAYHAYTVCVRPADIDHAVRILDEVHSTTKVGTVIGFPHGSSTSRVKVFETIDALDRGVKEIDFVINIGNVKSGQMSPVIMEMRDIIDAAKEHGVEKTKAIFETAYLTDQEIKMVAVMAEAARVDFVKTSTGFATAGATLAHVQLMRAAVGSGVEVKASGGIRDLDTLLTMRAAGVTRFGTSATKPILDDLHARLTTGQAQTSTYTAAY